MNLTSQYFYPEYITAAHEGAILHGLSQKEKEVF